jgi:hypothetical protein
MIYLNPNSANEVVCTLRDLCSNQLNPFYTWYIENKNTLGGIYFYADNNSQSPYYDSFTISTGGTGLTAGLINPDAGQWRYEVWEQTSPYQLSTASSLGMLETGIMIVRGTYSEFSSFTGSNTATINVFTNLDRI